MLKRKKTLTAIAIGLCVSGYAVIHAQKKVPTLTPQDYLEIQQLVAHYPYALDGKLDRGKAWADLFTDDAVFEHVGRQRYEGREQLSKVAAKGEATPNNLVHFIMNHAIDPTPEGAVGKQYLVLFSPFGEEKDGRRATSVSEYHYEDVYVKTANGWRFKSRTVIDKPASNPSRVPASQSQTRPR